MLVIANEKLLAGESAIVWLDDPNKYPYVRQIISTYFCRRKGQPPRSIRESLWKVVGYSELRSDAEHNATGRGWFTRRVFWVRAYDRADDPHGIYRTGAPTEAVDPMTVQAGKAGELTARAWGDA